jgi:hypothetical protein
LMLRKLVGSGEGNGACESRIAVGDSGFKSEEQEVQEEEEEEEEEEKKKKGMVGYNNCC